MTKITMKMEGAEGMPKTKVKGVDTGHIKSVIPSIIRFLIAIGYDNVTDVHIVMTGRAESMIYGKDGRVDREWANDLS